MASRDTFNMFSPPDERPDIRALFPDYDYSYPNRQITIRLCEDIFLIGLQQQAFHFYWSYAVYRLGGYRQINVGSGKMKMQLCLGLDIDSFVEPDIIGDATCLPRSDASLDLIIASHVLEHIPQPMNATIEHWLSKLCVGGCLAMILPDQVYHDVLSIDKTHVHVTDSRTFRQIIGEFSNVFVVRYNTMNNNHSFDVVLRKTA